MDDPKWKLINITVTLLILTLLYLPKRLFIFSPLLLAATALFLILLSSSTPQNIIKPQPETETELEVVPKSKLDDKVHDFDSFLEWDVSAPLEVIYEEESENEDDEETHNNNCLQRHTSLSGFFPESDSDTSSSSEYDPDWDYPEKICFMWDEDDVNGLIEISLDGKKGSDFEQEDNLIEIDISPASSSRVPAS